MPHGAAAEALVERAARLGVCTVEVGDDGAHAVALELPEPYDERGEPTAIVTRALTAVERWLREQPVPSVVVEIDGRRFTMARREARPRRPRAAV